MRFDRHWLRQVWKQLKQAPAEGGQHESLRKHWFERFGSSVARLQQRQKAFLRIEYPEELPISVRRHEIVQMVRDHRAVIVCGETGSGKSTQLPKLCLEAGFGRAGMIGHTQPRRIAARTIAARVADEMGTTVGQLVGCKVRFSDQTADQTLRADLEPRPMLAVRPE